MSGSAAAPGVPTLEFARVGLIYGGLNQAVEAVRDVSLTVADGEFLAIVGPSGCGKSSLLKVALGLETASAGSTRILGHEVRGPRREVGAVFQSPVLLPWRTVLENVLLPADVLKLDRAVLRPVALELLTLAGLRGFEDKYPFELSGGMQQRAGIVRALVHDPRVLMMDEPVAALDALTRETMSLELQRIWMERRKTILFVTHNIAEAVLLADRVAVMTTRPGRIAALLPNLAPRPRTIASLSEPTAVELARAIRAQLDLAHEAEAAA